MKKFKFPLTRLITPGIILVFILAIGIFYFLTFRYYQGSQNAKEIISKYLEEVALEKVDKEKAEQVINNLNQKETEEIDMNRVVNPFKVFEKEESSAETTPTP